MRKVLFRIVFDDPWTWQSVQNELHIGFAVFIAIWVGFTAIATGVTWKRTESDGAKIGGALAFLLIVPAVLVLLKLLVGAELMNLPLVANGIPAFGYGLMMFAGFATATVLAARRAPQAGIPSEAIWDLVFWVLIPGVVGARLWYVVQFRDNFFSPGHSLFSIFALWDGGIVFYGSLIGGLLGVAAFCYQRKISFWKLLDVLGPSLFVGLGFGRIGCFLYGCCYGDVCSLPWAVHFPKDSVTYEVMMQRGLLSESATTTMALHPTQIYSSINAFLLAWLLSRYFQVRQFDGAVATLAWVIYPITRFGLEILRGDEPGQLGTGLTISQLGSIGLITAGIVTMVILQRTQPPRGNATG